MKTMFFFLALITASPFRAEAHLHYCDHKHGSNGSITWLCSERTGETKPMSKKTIFTISGTHCKNPYVGNYDGPSYYGAERSASRLASAKCYPYQSILESSFTYEPFNECSERYEGAKATAFFSCAH